MVKQEVGGIDDVFQALAHPIRRGILEDLAAGPATVGELATPHDVSLPAISRHLRVLEDAGLIHVEPDGRTRKCELDPAPLNEALGWLTRYRIFWEDSLDALSDHLDATAPPHEVHPNEQA